MKYLMVEFDKMEINVDKMISAQQTGEAQNVQQGNQQGENIATGTGGQQSEIDDPQTIQRKGRPAKPKRLKPLIEEIKKKMVDAEKKKKKKSNDTYSIGNTKQRST